LLSKRKHAIIPVGKLKVSFAMKEKPDVLKERRRFFEVKAEDLP
jgi:hypothetical protein